MTKLIPVETIAGKILFLRNEKVLLDRDLAELYGVSTRALNQAVKRNKRRFPPDFMFRLTKKEKDETFRCHAPRFHGTGRGHVVIGAQQCSCHRGKHCYYAGLCSSKKDDCIS
jgi:hypothetical protein